MDVNAVGLTLAVVVVVALGVVIAGRLLRIARAPRDGAETNSPSPEDSQGQPVQPIETREEPIPASFFLGPDRERPEYLVRIHDGPATLSAAFREADGGFAGAAASSLGLAPGRLVSAVPALNQALKGGKILEIVGPPEVVRGLRDGTVELLRDKQGNLLGVTTKEGASTFYRNARFRELRTFVAPSVAFQFLAIATSQYYLAGINKKLDSILAGIDEILERMRVEAWGKLRGAEKTLSEVAAQLQVSQATGLDIGPRLATAEGGINAVMNEALENIRRLLARVDQLAETRPSKADCRRLLEEIEKGFRRDLRQYQEAVKARLGWFQVQLLLNARTDPSLEDLRLRQMKEQIDRFHDVLGQLYRCADILQQAVQTTAIPEGAIGKATDFVIRVVQAEDPFRRHIPARTKGDEELLARADKLLEMVSAFCPDRQLKPEESRAVAYRIRAGSGDELEWDVVEEETRPVTIGDDTQRNPIGPTCRHRNPIGWKKALLWWRALPMASTNRRPRGRQTRRPRNYGGL